MNIHSDIAEQIKTSVGMREAAEFYGLSPNRAGFICCPFHGEKTPSLKIYESSFYCFGCGAGGDVITFVRKLYDLDFKGAIARIDADFGLNLSLVSEQTEEDRRRIVRANAERKRREQEKAAISEKRKHYADMFRELWDKQKREPLTPAEQAKMNIIEDWLNQNP